MQVPSTAHTQVRFFPRDTMGTSSYRLTTTGAANGSSSETADNRSRNSHKSWSFKTAEGTCGILFSISNSQNARRQPVIASQRVARAERRRIVAFAPRNDVETHIRPLAARLAPELCRKSSLPIEGAGKAGAPSAPAASYVKIENIRVIHHRFTGSIRPSLRNGFNGFLRARPGDRAWLSPSPLRSVSFLRA
jgi:hypothetical protein